ncbi:MAG: hypothetical protein IKD47_04125 [Clostridia bacterium]|nr:hypothetical protein [Clostridia bacterium]
MLTGAIVGVVIGAAVATPIALNSIPAPSMQNNSQRSVVDGEQGTGV